MSKQSIKNRDNFYKALELERQGKLEDALMHFQKVSAADPLNEDAWNRSMVILRKQKKGEPEIKLIKAAIASYKKALVSQQKQWLAANKKKAELTRTLASTLGLLGANGLPSLQSETVERWESRLHLLSHRLANAKNKAKAKRLGKKQPGKSAKKTRPNTP